MIAFIDKDRYKPGQVIKVKSVWSLISPKPIWHYGVVVGFDDVVHFNLDVEIIDMSIIRTDLSRFKGCGVQLQVCQMSEFHKIYDNDQIIRRAISTVGTNFGGYDLLHNNCEHFANWCVSGEKFSNQVPFNEGEEHTLFRKSIDKIIVEPILKVADEIENSVFYELFEDMVE